MSDQPKPVNDPQADAGYDQPKPATGERFVMKDHMIFDTQVSAFIGAGDACYLLNESNAALAAENGRLRKMWEGGMIELERQLVAERENLIVVSRTIGDLREQLAAETRKYSDITHNWEQCVIGIQELKGQLDRKTEGQRAFAAKCDELQKQLAAEREASKALMQMHKEAVCKCNELREQLAEREKPQSATWVSPATAINSAIDAAVANEREKVQQLVKALQEIANGSEASADSLRRYAANELARFNQNTGLDWIGRGDQ